MCQACPNAIWMVLDPMTLGSYCNLTHHMSWQTGDGNTILMCDGPYLAEEEKEQKESHGES